MTPDAVALITYPGHCITTIQTIKNLQDLTSWQVPFYVFVDDMGEQYQNWSGNYIEDIEQEHTRLFPNTQFVYIKFSDCVDWFKNIWDGWLRQQVIKLNLDLFMPGDCWYVTDGDVCLPRVPSSTETPFNFVLDRDKLIHRQNETYNRYMLELDDVRLTYQDKPIFTHHAPFRWVTRSQLEKLKSYVSKLKANDFNLEHHNLMRQERIIGFGPDDSCLSMTEWDLLALHRARVENEDLDLHYWVCEIDQDYIQPTDQPATVYWTFFGTDRDLESLQLDINISEQLWNKTKNIKRN